MYAFTENFVLPISHDEVVHGKGSLLRKDAGRRVAALRQCRAFLAYMWAHPGKKLLFMGSEIGNPWEWNNDGAVPWDLLQYDVHSKLQLFVKELNRLYRSEPALFEVDFHHSGFEWVDFHDVDNSMIAFLRRAEDGSFLLFCCNFTPVPREKYRFGVPDEGFYEEILNTDSELFGGSNMGNGGTCLVGADPEPWPAIQCVGHVASPGGGCVQTARLIFLAPRTTGAIRLTTEHGAQESYDIHFCAESSLR